MGSSSIPFKNTSAMAILAEQRSALTDKSERSATSGCGCRRSNAARPLKSCTYEDNFNFAFSFYQPMIDYLDAKVSSGNVRGSEALPRLRFLEEQSLQQKSGGNSNNNSSIQKVDNNKSSSAMFRSYTERDLKSLIQAAEEEKESGNRTADEVSGARMRSNKQYAYSRGRAVTFNSNSNTTPFDRKREQGMSSVQQQRSSFSSLLSSSSSSFPSSGVKLGVSKSTLSSSGAAAASTSGTTTPAPQYSLAKECIKASLLTKSPVVDEIRSKLAESKRRFAEEKERESRMMTLSSGFRKMFQDDDEPAIFYEEDEEVDRRKGSPYKGIQRSHSFGAFTKKAKKDVQKQMAFNAVIQQQHEPRRSTAPLGRSISEAATACSSSSITELHSPVSFLMRRGSNKNVCFTSANDLMDDVMVAGVSDAPAPPVQFSATFDESRDDVEYWKDVW